MKIKERATFDSTNFTTEQNLEFFDKIATRYRMALKLSYTHRDKPTGDNLSGIIILNTKKQSEAQAFGSEIDLDDALINILIARAKDAETSDVAALLTAFAGKFLEEALAVGNFTHLMKHLALPQVGNLVCELIKKVKGQEDEHQTD